jgi:hypothetical protein
VTCAALLPAASVDPVVGESFAFFVRLFSKRHTEGCANMAARTFVRLLRLLLVDDDVVVAECAQGEQCHVLRFSIFDHKYLFWAGVACRDMIPCAGPLMVTVSSCSLDRSFVYKWLR